MVVEVPPTKSRLKFKGISMLDLFTPMAIKPARIAATEIPKKRYLLERKLIVFFSFATP